MTDDLPTDRPFDVPPRRSRMGVVVIGAAIALILGLALMAFAVRQRPAWLSGQTTTPAAVPTAAPATVAPATDTAAIGSREAALAAQIASLETRAATLATTTTEAENRAGRAEAILVVFAARRALDRGVGLGYLEEQLRNRFGVSAPRETAVVLHAARNPVTLEDLRESLDSAVPTLLARESDWWAGIGSELRNLVVVHKAGTPSPLPSDRLARVRRLLAQSNVEAALAEVRRLPGAAHATSWTEAARRYVDAHRALDQLEAVAIVGPVPATTTPTAPVTAPAPVPSPAAPDNGTFF